MRSFWQILMIGLLFLGHLEANEARRRTVVGEVLSVTVDDLTESFGITQDQERYSVRVTLDSVNRLVLGFGKPGKELSDLDELKLTLLLEALDKGYTVALRLDSVVTADFVPSHARILAVSVQR